VNSTNCCIWFALWSVEVSGLMSGMSPISPATTVPP
jgi:hypothetical protein